MADSATRFDTIAHAAMLPDRTAGKPKHKSLVIQMNTANRAFAKGNAEDKAAQAARAVSASTARVNHAEQSAETEDRAMTDDEMIEAGTFARSGDGEAMTIPEQAVANTDREIWREREGDYYADSIHVTQGGGIGINCGGHVIVKPIREWHKLALVGVQRPEDVARTIRENVTLDSCGCCELQFAKAAAAVCALPHTGQPQEGDHERDSQVVTPIGQER